MHGIMYFIFTYAVSVVPECSLELKPVVGQKFSSLVFAVAFYDVYARAVGFDTRKQGTRKVDNVITWNYVIYNREGSKRSSDESDQMNALSGFTVKRRRLSKRCGCAYFSEGGNPAYVVHTFNEVHNLAMVEVQHQHFMSSNRKLDDVHGSSDSRTCPEKDPDIAKEKGKEKHKGKRKC